MKLEDLKANIRTVDLLKCNTRNKYLRVREHAKNSLYK